MRSRFLHFALVLIGLLCATAFGAAPRAAIAESPSPNAGPKAGNVNSARLAAEANTGENWLVKGGRLTGEHFSPLDQIDADNVDELGLAWSTDIASPIGLVGEPLVVDGVVYLSAPLSVVHALNAKTGELLWSFDPAVDPSVSGGSSIASRFNRGVAVWKGLVIVGTGDCRLVAIDAAAGTKVWDKPACDAQNGSHMGGGSGITGAPLVADDKVFTGYLGSEAGARGSIAGFDAATGEQLWRFWTVPGDPSGPMKGVETKELEIAAKTWPTGWAEYGAGGVWDAIHYDSVTGFVIFGTGSPIPHAIDQRGEGDVLYTNSVIAVDGNTGAYQWHYQTVPSDAWDYDATMPKIVTDLEIGGKKRHVVLEAGKSGFFYVLDARTGELLAADAIAKVTWASHIDMETGRPVTIASGRFWESENPAPIFPSGFGARNWEPPAFSPETKLVYMPVANMPSPFTAAGYPATGVDSVNLGPDEIAPPNSGKLLAWDPVKREERWSADHVVPFNGGVLATSGDLVFQGLGTGELAAYHARTGDRLWSRKTGSSIQAAPVTYRLGDDQYVLVAAGAGGGMRLIINRATLTEEARGPARVFAFKLNGKAKMPGVTKSDIKVPKPPPRILDAEQMKQATANWAMFDCQTCHGAHAIGLSKIARGGAMPDLRYSPFLHAGWESVVLDGALASKGMIPFRPRGMTPEQAEEIRGYVIEHAWKVYEKENSK